MRGKFSLFLFGTIEWKTKQLEQEKRKREDLLAKEKAAKEQIAREQAIHEKGRLLEKLSACTEKWESTHDGFKYNYLWNYYPISCELNLSENKEELVWNVRNLIWNFKKTKGKIPQAEHDAVINVLVPKVVEFLINTFGNTCQELTLVCITAATEENTKRRYEQFSKRVCEATKMIDGNKHISFVIDGISKHDCPEGQSQREPVIEFDEDFFKGKYVLLFDDVRTKGTSMDSYRRKLTNMGTIVVGGLTLAMTKHSYVGVRHVS